MSSHRPWYKHYPADFIAGTVAMTAEEKGAYIVVLNLIYDRGAPLVDDPQWLARVVGCSTRRWKQLRESLIKHGKVFITEDGKLFNKRAGQQLESDAKESEIYRESGAKGGKKAAEIRRNSSDNSGLGVTGLVQNSEHIPEARSQKPEEVPASQGADAPTETVSSSKAPATGDPGMPRKPKQESFLTPTPSEAIMSEGASILARLLDKPLAIPENRGFVFRLLNNLRTAAGHDDLLLSIIHDAAAKPPREPISWIQGRIKSRRGGGPAGSPTLLVDNDPTDLWGIRAWCRDLLAQGDAVREDEHGKPMCVAHGWQVNVLARSVATAAQLPSSWRGDWSPLLGWLAAGLSGTLIVDSIKSRASRVGYEAPDSLRFFDVLFRDRKAA